MTAKKRKPRIVTEATKAKLPKPRKRRPAPDLSIVGLDPAPDFRVVPIGGDPATAPDGAVVHAADGSIRHVRRNGKWVTITTVAPPVPVPSITNAEYLRDGKPGTGAQVPCMDWPADSLPSGDVRVTDAAMLEFAPIPDTAPYPWPLRVLGWVDERIVAARTRLAAWLRALSRKVAP